MDREEFAVIAAALQTYYPRFNIMPNEQAMYLWYDELKDISSEVLTAALKKWVVTEKWPPTIADLRGACDEVVNGDRPGWDVGWMEVQHAVRRYGFMQPKEAMAAMGEITQEAIRRIGWTNICESENPEALRAQFRQVYEICEKRTAGDRKLPPVLRDTIRRIQMGRSMVPELESGN